MKSFMKRLLGKDEAGQLVAGLEEVRSAQRKGPPLSDHFAASGVVMADATKPTQLVIVSQTKEFATGCKALGWEAGGIEALTTAIAKDPRGGATQGIILDSGTLRSLTVHTPQQRHFMVFFLTTGPSVYLLCVCEAAMGETVDFEHKASKITELVKEIVSPQ